MAATAAAKNKKIRQDYKWYTYELVDPRDMKAFYIGKGTKERIKDHVRQAKTNSAINQEKTKRILSILDQGLTVIERKTAYFNDEQFAYDHEATLIKTTKNLTNISKSGKARVKMISFFDCVSECITKGTGKGKLELFRFSSLPTTEHRQLYIAALRVNRRAF